MRFLGADYSNASRDVAFGSGNMKQHLQYISPTSCFFVDKKVTKWLSDCHMN